MKPVDHGDELPPPWWTRLSAEGWFVVLTLRIESWPYPTKNEMGRAQTDGAQWVIVTALEDGRFEIKTTSKNNDGHTVTTCPITTEGPAVIILDIRWDAEHVEVGGNFKLIASTASPGRVVEALRCKPLQRATPQDYSLENRAARANRRAQLGASATRPDRLPGSVSRDFTMLSEDFDIIVDELQALAQRRMHRLKTLAATLRALIVGQSRRMSLLQRCAAHIDAPLLVYAPPIENLAQTLASFGEGRAFFPAATFKRVMGNVERVDLDIWLSKAGAAFEGRVVSNIDLLRAYGDTEAGHRDFQQEPIVGSMRENLLHGDGASSLEVWLGTVAETVRDLIRDLLWQRSAAHSGLAVGGELAATPHVITIPPIQPPNRYSIPSKTSDLRVHTGANGNRFLRAELGELKGRQGVSAWAAVALPSAPGTRQVLIELGEQHEFCLRVSILKNEILAECSYEGMHQTVHCDVGDTTWGGGTVAFLVQYVVHEEGARLELWLSRSPGGAASLPLPYQGVIRGAFSVLATTAGTQPAVGANGLLAAIGHQMSEVEIETILDAMEELAGSLAELEASGQNL